MSDKKYLLTKEDIEDLLINVLNTDKVTMWKGSKIQFCCTVHGESNPSAGVNCELVHKDSGDILQWFNCLSCGAKGSLESLVMQTLPEQYPTYNDVVKLFKQRYNKYYPNKLERNLRRIKRVKEYHEDTYKNEEQSINEISLVKYKCGKETFKYFYERGFNKEDVKKFNIGRDLEENLIIIPIYSFNSNLMGIIGRYVTRKKKKRFKIFDFEKSKTLYPVHLFEPTKDRVIIMCEGLMDSMLMHKWGFKNTLATMGDLLSEEQAKYIQENCDTIYDLFDNDRGGDIARERVKEMLPNIRFKTPTYYPEYGKDISDWGREEVIKILNSCKSIKRIKKY